MTPTATLFTVLAVPAVIYIVASTAEWMADENAGDERFVELK